MRYRNPDGTRAGQPLLDVVRWHITRRLPRPRQMRAAETPTFPIAPDKVSATWLGHASALLRFGATGPAVLTDPVFGNHVGPFPWLGARRITEPPAPSYMFPKPDVVLVSHSHYDHADVPSLLRAQEQWNVPIVTGRGNRRWMRRAGLREVVELDWWDTIILAGAAITFLPMKHGSGRGLFDQARTLWGGFGVRVTTPEVRRSVVFAGDTAFGWHFEDVRERFGEPDLALLPVGGYEPRWFTRSVHMDPEEAVRAHRILKARVSMAIHHGTFALTEEPPIDPWVRLAQARRDWDVPVTAFRVVDAGESVLV